MRSLRSRLLALWLMLAVSGVVTGLLLVEFYRQSTNAQVGRAEEAVARSCRELDDRYQFFVSGRRVASIDDTLKHELVTIVLAALRQSPGVEGGIWQADAGSLAYASRQRLRRSRAAVASGCTIELYHQTKLESKKR